MEGMSLEGSRVVGGGEHGCEMVQARTRMNWVASRARSYCVPSGPGPAGACRWDVYV